MDGLKTVKPPDWFDSGLQKWEWKHPLSSLLWSFHSCFKRRAELNLEHWDVKTKPSGWEVHGDHFSLHWRATGKISRWRDEGDAAEGSYMCSMWCEINTHVSQRDADEGAHSWTLMSEQQASKISLHVYMISNFCPEGLPFSHCAAIAAVTKGVITCFAQRGVAQHKAESNNSPPVWWRTCWTDECFSAATPGYLFWCCSASRVVETLTWRKIKHFTCSILKWNENGKQNMRLWLL